MLVFDAHLDLAWNALDFNRDLFLSIEELRAFEKASGDTFKARGRNTVTFPELRNAHVGIFIATLLARMFQPGSKPPIQRYNTRESAEAAALGQLAYYRRLERQGHLRFIKDSITLQQHVNAWKTGIADDEPLGFILSMEGADPILRPDDVQEWFDLGLRIVGPTHYGISTYGHGTATEGGFFPLGPPLLREMERVGMILDVTHLSDQCFDEAMDIYHGPMLASHHNCRALVPDQRQLTDAQIQQLIARGAVIGSALDAWMLSPNWQRGITTPQDSGVTMNTFVDHIDHVCQLAGNCRHAAIGTDLDGGFGTEQTAMDLDTIARLQVIPELLSDRNYSADDIEAIMYGNWLRFFTETWAKA